MGRGIDDARALAARMAALVADGVDGQTDAELGPLAVFGVAARYPMRRGCVLLPWQVFAEAIAPDASEPTARGQ